MLETSRLILDKAKYADWKDMYENVWSHPESARYMLWNVTENEEQACARIQRTIEWQKDTATDSRNGEEYRKLRYRMRLE